MSWGVALRLIDAGLGVGDAVLRRYVQFRRHSRHSSINMATYPLGVQQGAGARMTAIDRRRLVELDSAYATLWRSLEFEVIEDVIGSLPSEGIALDLGCGDGSFASLLPYAFQIGVDLDIDSLGRARAGVPRYQMVACADASRALPVKPGSLDLVFCNSVIEHIPNIDGVIEQIGLSLRIRGLFLFTVPSRYSWTWVEEVFGHGEASDFHRLMGHVHLLTLDEWADLLRDHGFDVVQGVYYASKEFLILLKLLAHPTIGIFWRRCSRKLVLRTLASFWGLVEREIGLIDAESPGGGLIVLAKKTTNRKAGI